MSSRHNIQHMKLSPFIALVFFFLVGCETPTPSDPNARDWYDRGLGNRDGYRGYRVAVEVSDPGCRIEVNEEHIATITDKVGEIILWGDSDGRFRGNQITRIVANPVKPGQHQQSKIFSSSAERTPVPHRLYFDLNLQPTKPTEKIDLNVR